MTSEAIIVRRRPTRSDSTPPAIAKSANGMPLAARTMPRSVASPISRTANAIATAIMRSPTTDSDCPAKRSRNGSRARIVEGMWTWTRPPMAGLTLPAGRRGGTFAGGPAVGRRSCAARRGRLSRHPLEHGGVDIEVAVDLADVVVVLEGVDQAHEAPGDLLVERHAGLRVLDDLGVLELDARGLERGAHRREVAGLGEHLEDVVVDRDVERAGLDRGQQVVLRVARAVDDDHAALVEEVRDGAGFPQVAAVLGEHVADLGARAVAVVGQRLDEQRDAARPIALVEDGLERVGVRALAGALGDRALDVVLGHRGVLGLLDRQAERGVALGVAAALLRRDGDRARELREQLSAAGVDDRLLVLDPRPFRVTGHGPDGSGRAGIPRIAVMATVPEQIFKAYDVRGLYGEDIDEEIAEQLGRAFVRVLADLAGKDAGDLRVGLGRDMRLTAPELSERYKRGMVSEGAHVLDAGQVGTEMLYFLVGSRELDGGLMCTASHNPKAYTGAKLVREGAIALSGDEGIQDMRRMVESGMGEPPGGGSAGDVPIAPECPEAAMKFTDPSNVKPRKVVVDGGNGMGGPMVGPLLDQLPL